MQVLKLHVASTKAYTAQIAALAFLAKAVGEANGNEKAKAFDLVHELSIVAQSIESTLSEKELIDAKVRDLLEINTQRLLHRTWSRLLCSRGSQSQAQRDFLHPM